MSGVKIDSQVKIEDTQFEIVLKDTSNLWDQLRELVQLQHWTTQDHATLSLLQEQKNVTSIFAARKPDNFLLGAVILIETDDLVYANIYVIRDEYRALGLGMKMVGCFVNVLETSFWQKPFICRGVDEMMLKYAGPPFYASLMYNLFSIELKDKALVLDIIPPPASHKYTVQAIRDMTPRQFEELIHYDKYITGVNRTKFLKDFYSIAYVDGIVIRDKKGFIRGQAAIVPTTAEPNTYKLNPVYAESKEDAGVVVQAILDRVNDPLAKFIIHCRTESAGDWIIDSCKERGIDMHLVGALCSTPVFKREYKDPSRTKHMYAPTNSPAHFDG